MDVIIAVAWRRLSAEGLARARAGRENRIGFILMDGSVERLGR
jgi:hypothetical protein